MTQGSRTTPFVQPACSKSTKRIRKPRNHKQQHYEWFSAPHNAVLGEKALWVAVITQAMMDALSNAQNAEAQYHKHEAQCWLTSNSRDFATVCHLAGMDPDSVRKRAKQVLASPKPWRAEAGKGKRYLERKAYRKKRREAMASPLAPLIPPSFPNAALVSVIAGPWIVA